MRTQEIQHGALGPGMVDRFTQGSGSKSRQIKETLGALLLPQNPAERIERDHRGLLRLVLRDSIVCHQSNSQLVMAGKTSRRHSGTQ